MYLALKLLHVTAVVLFLGNITTGLFWHAHAARTREAKFLFHSMDGIIRSDRWFTVPSIVVLTLTGILMAVRAGLPILHTPWILGAVVLFSLSGVLFAIRVAPLQKQSREIARAGMSSGAFDYEAFHRVARRWELWGAGALLLPFGALALMVFKPA